MDSDTSIRDLYIGAYDDGTSNIKGQIDEVFICNRALTEQEIQNIYNARSRHDSLYTVNEIK